jgi:hypothetical protein
MRSFVATIFGRATLVLPSCDGPFTWIVQAIAMVSQGALTLSLGPFTSPILVRQFSRLENGPNKRRPRSSVAYQPSLTARKSDWHSLM